MTKRGAADSKGPDKKRSKVGEDREGGGAEQKVEDVDTDASAVQLIGAACKFHKPGELEGGRGGEGRGGKERGGRETEGRGGKGREGEGRRGEGREGEGRREEGREGKGRGGKGRGGIHVVTRDSMLIHKFHKLALVVMWWWWVLQM